MRLLVYLLFAFAVIYTNSAYGQNVIEADTAKLVPQITRDASGFSKCGLRSMVMVSAGDVVDIYDFSMSLSSDYVAATTKAGKSVESRTSVMSGKPSKNSVVIPGPKSFWFARELQGKPVTMLKILPADTPGFILGVADMNATFDVIMAAVKGERVHFAIRYASEPIERVVAFSAPLTDNEKMLMGTCLSELVARLQKGLASKK